MVACVVVVPAPWATVVDDTDDGGVVGVVCEAVDTFNGARVAEGISSAPITTATTTTPTPRRTPEGGADPGSRSAPPLLPEPEAAGYPGSS
jgi:hypothetical protein